MNSFKSIYSNSIDVRIVLSLLWVARMLSGLQGDSTRLHDPDALQDLLANTSDVVVTKELLFIMSVVFSIPIFMVILSLLLKQKTNRITNMVLGVFFVLFDLSFLILFLNDFSYETYWSFVYLVFPVLIVWQAYKWKKA